MAATASVGAEAPIGGEAIYQQSCARCHNPGPGSFFTGAPKIGAAYWATRLEAAGSIDVLVADTARGKGKMPPQGGPEGLKEEDIRAAVEYILSQQKPQP